MIYNPISIQFCKTRTFSKVTPTMPLTVESHSWSEWTVGDDPFFVNVTNGFFLLKEASSNMSYQVYLLPLMQQQSMGLLQECGISMDPFHWWLTYSTVDAQWRNAHPGRFLNWRVKACCRREKFDSHQMPCINHRVFLDLLYT